MYQTVFLMLCSIMLYNQFIPPPDFIDFCTLKAI